MALAHVERNWGGNPHAVSFDLKEVVADYGDGMPVYAETRPRNPEVGATAETADWRHYMVVVDIEIGRVGVRSVYEP